VKDARSKIKKEVKMKELNEQSKTERPKALICAHGDGHGLICAVLSKKVLEKEGFEVEILCGFKTGDVKNFWEKTIDNIKDEYEKVVIVDIPLHKDVSLSFSKLKKLDEKVKEIWYIDHHPRNLLELLPIENFYIVDNPGKCYYGFNKIDEDADEKVKLLVRLGQIADRDPSVTPSGEEQIVANGISYSLFSEKYSLNEIINKLENIVSKDNWDFFKKLGQEFYDKYCSLDRVKCIKNVAVVDTSNVEFKLVWNILHRVIDVFNINYAIGVREFEHFTQINIVRNPQKKLPSLKEIVPHIPYNVLIVGDGAISYRIRGKSRKDILKEVEQLIERLNQITEDIESDRYA